MRNGCSSGIITQVRFEFGMRSGDSFFTPWLSGAKNAFPHPRKSIKIERFNEASDYTWSIAAKEKQDHSRKKSRAKSIRSILGSTLFCGKLILKSLSKMHGREIHSRSINLFWNVCPRPIFSFWPLQKRTLLIFFGSCEIETDWDPVILCISD